VRTATTLVLASALLGCAGEEILHGLEEPQANEVLVALDERGVPATKEREEGADARWRVEVARGDATRARRILSERDLPRERPPGFADVFSNGSMIPTSTEEHALYLHALAGELARSVEAIDGVVEARVHLGLRQADPLRPGERASPRGAVLVKCRAAACPAVRDLEPGIRAIVAGAADGLDAGAVSVVFAEAAESTASAPRERPRVSALLVGLAAAAALAAVAVALATPSVRARLRREVTS
jgi:type III secretion protein J